MSEYVYQENNREGYIADSEFTEIFPVSIFDQVVSSWNEYLNIEKGIEYKGSK